MNERNMEWGEIRYLFFTLNIWLVFTAVLMVGVTVVSLSQPPRSPGVGYLLPALLVYFVYVAERLALEPEDLYNHPYRTSMVRQLHTPLFFSELLALVGYEALLAFLVLNNPTAGLEYVAGGQLPLLVLGLYSRLKRHPMFDSLAVGGIWAFVIVFTVVVSSDFGLTEDVLAPFIGWFLITGAGVESRNIEDRYGDSRTNKHTLAGYLGWKGGTVLVMTLKTLGVLLFYVWGGLVPASLTLGILVLLRAFRTLTDREVERMKPSPPSGPIK